MDCLSPEQIDAFLDGRMTQAERERAEAHVDVCASCRVLLGRVASETRDAKAEAETAVEGKPAKRSSAGTIPTSIGRYQILKKLGAGGMGVVLLAEDEDLKRKVVIKLLRPEMVEGETDGRERLLREAQAMAKVSHVNVVPIYDVGVHDGKVFLAMEYLDGGDLATWLDEERRDVERVVEVFVQAGRGLAAAHRAGLVHRDFKPHNVLLGKTGEVKVTDFGLARTELAAPSRDRKLDRRRPKVSTTNNDLSVASLLDSPITQTGTMVGTPAYMAPEQILAQFVDARTDQFSFCVALHEGLYGERPWAGVNTEELFEATLEGKLPAAPADRRVPARVRDALKRGLAVEPSDRFPTMEPLLATLAPKRRAVWIAAAAGVLGVAAAVTITVMVRGSHEQCIGLDNGLAGAWDVDVAKRMKAAFVSAGAEKSFDPVAAIFDRYAKTWTDVRVEACKSTRVRGDQGEDALARRNACLEARKVELGALAKRLVDDAPATHEQAANAASRLVLPTICANAAAVAFPQPNQHDKKARELEIELARVSADLALGPNEATREKIAEIIKLTEDLPYPPLQADSHMLAASAATAMGDTKMAEAELRTALRLAELGQYDHGRARANLQLASLLLSRGDVANAINATDTAEATLTRIGGDSALANEIARVRAGILRKTNKGAEAATLLERVIEQQIALTGPESLNVTTLYLELGATYFDLGRTDESNQAITKAQTIIEKNFPAEDGMVIVKILGDSARAMNAGDLRRCIELSKQAVALMQVGKANEQLLSRGLLGVATCHYGLDELAPAKEYFLRAAEEFAKQKSSGDQAMCLESAGRIEHEQEHDDAAIALYRRCLTVAEPDGDQYVNCRQGLGRSLARSGSVDDAMTELEWALPRLEKMMVPPLNMIGSTRLAIAEALWRRARPGDRERAKSTARLAREAMLQHRARFENVTGFGAQARHFADKSIARVDKWIKEHQ